VRDIIRRAGLAAGTFYNYYRSKEEVFAALSDDGARRFAPILKGLRGHGHSFEAFVRLAIAAYFEFLADEHNNWVARRPAGEPHVHIQGETPEMAAVFAEVRDALSEAIADRQGPAADPDYMAAACIAIAREVGDKMLERRPIDTKGATAFAVTMILDGLRGLPKAQV
jgi:AcrR family transcriptional regulator